MLAREIETGGVRSMRCLVQRVRHARVEVAGEVTGAIENGLLILVGVGEDDGDREIEVMTEKIVNLRIFNDADGKFNLSLLDVGGGALVVSQFTLYADVRRGRRPSFTAAGRPGLAEPLVDRFAQRLVSRGVARVEQGSFGADMDVHLCNQGPVTIWLDSADLVRG